MTEDRMERWDANSLMGRPPSTHNMVVESEKVLSTRVGIEGINMNLYRLVILARLIVVGFFFHLRITKPVKDGYGLWITAVVCEIWLAVSWILDQLPKWSPINRLTHLDRLSTRFEKEGEREGEECCGLASVDVMVSTEDPVREAPLMTANAVLSVLALDYPARKVSCYVSDDASAMLTFECLSETAEFARRWVPFCKEFNIEPRAPEPYFSHKIDYLRDKVKPEFVKRRRQMKREYDEFKVGINALVKKREKAPDDGWMMQDGTPWPGNNPRNHPGMIQVFLGRTGTLDVRGNELPLLVYMSREKKPGYHHYNKPGAMNALVRVSGVLTNSPYIMNMDCTHYINNSKVVREAMCFMMDSLIGRNISYVQFPLRFHALQQGNKYSSHNSVFYDITMKGLDGIQGPICLGTACVIRRQALYGYVPPPLVQHHSQSLWSYCLGNFSMRAKQHRFTTCSKILRAQIDLENSYEYDYDLKESLNPIQNLEDCLGQSPVYIASTMMEEGGIPEAIDPSSLIKEAIHVINCTYEEKTKWGKEIGWIYGSLTYNVLTGMKMHARGWQSVYCVPFRPAFKVNETMNLADSLREVLHRALGSMEILLSKHCPLWYRWRSGQMDCLQRIAYINIVVYPLASLPLIGYCFLPAVCLLTGKFIVSPLDNIGIMWVTGLLTSVMACAILELKWSQVEIEEWWRNQQFWVIGGTSSHFFAILQGLLKVLTGIETSATDTSHSKPTCEKQGDADDLKEMYKFKWTNLLIIPTTLVIVNILAVVAGISATFNSGYEAWESLSIKLCFAFWVLVHLYPFLRGLLGRQNRTPTIVIIWSTLLASIFSLLWIRADPFIQENKVA